MHIQKQHWPHLDKLAPSANRQFVTLILGDRLYDPTDLLDRLQVEIH